jgi:hypothetical protein
MKKLISNKPFIILLAVFISIVFYFVYEASEAYEQYDIPFAFECNKTTDFSIYDALEGCDSNNILSNFDYQLYLEKGNYCDFNSLENDITIIDSIYNDFYNITLPLFYAALSDSMIKIEQADLDNYNPDYLINKLGWLERFNYYAECSPRNNYLYGGIEERWMQSILDELDTYLNNNKKLKYASKFKTIVSICKLHGKILPIKLNSLEKTSDYLVEGRYTYIWKRFWENTGIIIKIILLFGILFTLYSVQNTIYSLIKKNRNEK